MAAQVTPKEPLTQDHALKGSHQLFLSSWHQRASVPFIMLITTGT